jgi:hypothetical protein
MNRGSNMDKPKVEVRVTVEVRPVGQPGAAVSAAGVATGEFQAACKEALLRAQAVLMAGSDAAIVAVAGEVRFFRRALEHKDEVLAALDEGQASPA